MPKRNISPSILFHFCLIAGLGALLAGLLILTGRPASPDAGGYAVSFARTGIAAAIFAVAVGLIATAIRASKDAGWASGVMNTFMSGRSNLILAIFASIFVGGWIAVFLPAYRVPASFSAYLAQLQPVLIWLTLLNGAGFAILLVQRRGWHWNRLNADLDANPSSKRAGLLSLVVMLILFLLVLLTGIGVVVREDYWYNAGVPILASQIAMAVLAGAMVWWAETNHRLPKILASDRALFVTIWLVAAIAWAREPLMPSFFLTDPQRPNREFYPYSDAATFDAYSQLALIGQGLANRNPIDRPLYPAFLTYLHQVAGQDFERLMAVQAAIYAVFPALMYLLANQMHGRAAGVGAATLALLRGLSAIEGSAWTDLAGPKMPLTDFPAAILIALACLLIIYWLRDTERGKRSAVWAGGIFALAILSRTNALLLVPAMLALALAAYKGNIRTWSMASALLLGAMLLTTLPWDLRNQSNGGRPLGVYLDRIQFGLNSRLSAPPTPTQTPSSLAPSLRRASAAGPDVHAWSMSEQPLDVIGRRIGADICTRNVACSVVNHYMHNMVTSMLILPTSVELHDLPTLLRTENYYWDRRWSGQGFGSTAALLMTFNLAILALGMKASWQNLRIAGLVPAWAFFVYGGANALARTSGGRYVVPMDWIVALMFAVGTFELLRLVGVALGANGAMGSKVREAQARKPRAEPGNFAREIVIPLATLMIIGALMPAVEYIYSRRYAVRPPEQVLADLQDAGMLEAADLTRNEIRAFLLLPEARLLTGRALYPRYYPGGRGELVNDYPYAVQPYPRLVLSLIGPEPGLRERPGVLGVVLPYDRNPVMPHTSDVIVLGCTRGNGFDAFAVFVTGPISTVLSRSPSAGLSCPIPEPICDQNHNCR